MTDLELLDLYCEKCRDFIDPVLFRDIEKRGLVYAINRLPSNINEAKSMMRGRLVTTGRYIGDPEIEAIADTVHRLESLCKELQGLNMADADRVLHILNQMQDHATYVLNYYNKKP